MITNQNLFFKLVLIGEDVVGKSSLLYRVYDDQFNENRRPTVGIDFQNKTFSIDGKSVKTQIWDTPGQKYFKDLISVCYRNADGIIIIYDVSDEQSFKNIQFWVSEMKKHVSSDVQLMLIGNKIDLEEKQVSTETAYSYAQANQMEFFEVSAKTSESVMQAFLSLTRKLSNKKEAEDLIIKAEQLLNINKQGSQNQTFTQNNLAKKEKDGCY